MNPSSRQLFLELLESRLVPTVNVSFSNGQLIIDGGSSSASLMTVTSASKNNTETFLLTGDQFNITSDPAHSLVLGKTNAANDTLTLATSNNPLNSLTITQAQNIEALILGMSYINGTGNITITAPGDSVTLNSITTNGTLSDTSGTVHVDGNISSKTGSITITGNGGVTDSAALSAGADITITGSGSSTGDVFGVSNTASISAGGNINITGTGFGNGYGFGVSDSGSLVAKGNITITGNGSVGGNFDNNFGVALNTSHSSTFSPGSATATSLIAGGNITITGEAEATGNQNYGTLINIPISAGGNITISGNAAYNNSTNFGLFLGGNLPPSVPPGYSVTLNGITSNTALLTSTSSLVIQGQGFDPLASNNTITFDHGVTGTISSVSADGTQMTVALSGIFALPGGTVLHASITNSTNPTPYLVAVGTIGPIPPVLVNYDPTAGALTIDASLNVSATEMIVTSSKTNDTESFLLLGAPFDIQSGSGSLTLSSTYSTNDTLTIATASNPLNQLTLLQNRNGEALVFGLSYLGSSSQGNITIQGTGNSVIFNNVITPGSLTDTSLCVRGLGSISTGGSVTLIASGTGSTGSNYGVYLNGNITSGGSVSISGSGSSNGLIGYAFGVKDTASISAVGNISVSGSGGGSGRGNSGVSIGSYGGSGLISSSTGSITITGTGSSYGSNINNYGVTLISESVNANGNVNIIGSGGGTGLFSSGVRLLKSPISTSGSITITGTGSGTGSDYNYGVSVVANSLSASNSINITGSSESYGNNDYGVYLAVPISSSSGSVTITGSGSSQGLNGNFGVDDATTISANGEIIIQGTAGGTGSSNFGIHLAKSISSTTSSVILFGTGSSSGFNSNYGILDGGTLTANNNISITGIGGGTGSGNFGVVSSTVSSSTGSISLTGTGSGQGLNNGYGLLVKGSIAANSNINITGNSGGTGSSNWGLRLGNTVSSSTGSISIAGTGSATSTGDSNFGVDIAKSVISNSNVTILGSGAGSGANNYGINLLGAIASTSGSITISGTGDGLGTKNNFGVQGSKSIVAPGNITITGSGAGSSTNNFGVSLSNPVTAGGNAIITGTGNNTATNFGLQLDGQIPVAVTAGGSIILNGIIYSQTQLSPTSTSLIISGTVFDPVATNNTITFNNGVTGTITSVSPFGTSMTVAITGGLSSLTAGTVLTASVTNNTILSPYLVPVAIVTAGQSNVVHASYTNGTLTINGINSTATAMQVISKTTFNSIIFKLTGAGFTIDTAPTGSIVVSTTTTSNDTLTIPTSYFPLNSLLIEQAELTENLTLGITNITGTGNISIFAPGDAVTFNAISTSGSLTSSSGPVTIAGNITSTGSFINISGNASGSSLPGLTSTGVIQASGNISLYGGSGGGGNKDFGVDLGNSVTSSNGSISIIGGGSSNASFYDYGVKASSTIAANGNITIVGSGGGAANGDYGVNIAKSITSTSGSVTITGTGSSSGVHNNWGVNDSGTVIASGTIQVSGSGGGTGYRNFGVHLASKVTSTSGSVTITGTSGSKGYHYNFGVKAYNAITASGNITISGSGGGGSGYFNNYNFGTYLYGSVNAGGNVTITGTGNNTFTNQGLNLFGGVPASVTAGGSITLNGITYSLAPQFPDSVVIYGQGFDPVAANNNILFNDGFVGTITSVNSAGTRMTVSLSGGPPNINSKTVLMASITNKTITSPYLVAVATLKPLQPYVKVNFDFGQLSIDASSSSASDMVVTSNKTNNTETFLLTNGAFEIISDPSYALILSSTNSPYDTLTLPTSTFGNQLDQLSIVQAANIENLTFGMQNITGEGNITISAPGDTVDFNSVSTSGSITSTSGSVSINGNLNSSSGSINITAKANQGYGVTDQGAINAYGNISITGTGGGIGSNNFGIHLTGNIASTTGSVTLSGSGASQGLNENFGIADSGSITASGDITITGSGDGTGSQNDGVSLSGLITAGGNVTITGTSNNLQANLGLQISGGVPSSVTGGGSLTFNGINYNAAAILLNTQSLVITGSGFDPVPANNTLMFSNGVTGSIISVNASGTSMTVAITGGLDKLLAGTVLYASITNSTITSPYLVPVATLGRSAQTINFPALTSPLTYSPGLTVTLNATGGGSGNPVIFSIDPKSTATGTISGSVLTVTSAGTLFIDANQAGNNNYNAATQVQQSLVVNAASQTITFTPLTSPISFNPNQQVTLVATASSQLGVTFTVDSSSTGTGTIIGNVLTITAAGTIVIDANQSGNNDYNAAPQVQQSLVVNKISQTISFNALTSPIPFVNNQQVTLAANATSGLSVVFTIDSSSTGTGSISGNILTITGGGTFVLDANQAGNSVYAAAPQVQQQLVVTRNNQTINFTPPTTPVSYKSGMTVNLQATGGNSGNPVVFTIDSSSSGAGTISGTVLTITTAGTILIDANQAGNVAYNPAPQVQETLVVNKSNQTITFTPPVSQVVFVPNYQVTLVASATSGLGVVFTIDAASTGKGTINGNVLTITGAGILLIDTNQAGNANYNAAPQVQYQIAVKAKQTISFPAIKSLITYASSAQVTLTATASSALGVVFTLDPSSTGKGTISGNVLNITGTGTFVIDANQAGNNSYFAATQVQQSVVVELNQPNRFPASRGGSLKTSNGSYISNLNVTNNGPTINGAVQIVLQGTNYNLLKCLVKIGTISYDISSLLTKDALGNWVITIPAADLGVWKTGSTLQLTLMTK